MASIYGLTSAVRAAAPVVSYIDHLPMPISVGLAAAYVFLRRSTLLWVVAAVGMHTKDQERRRFCERAMARLSYRRPLQIGRRFPDS